MRSGRWQARFTVPLGHPSGRGGQTVTAPHTFEPTTYGKEAAGDWLRDEERRLNADGAAWVTLAELAEAERARVEREAVVTFGEYSAVWLRTRRTKNGPLPAPKMRPASDDYANRGHAGDPSPGRDRHPLGRLTELPADARTAPSIGLRYELSVRLMISEIFPTLKRSLHWRS